MAEDIEGQGGATEAPASAEDSTYQQILAGEGTDPQKTVTEGEAPAQEPAQSEQQALDPEEVLTFEIDGKDIPIKRKDISTLAQLSEREAKLAEKEKSLNKDYTSKTQALAEERKSIVTAFGGKIPDTPLLEALGRMYQQSFSNKEYAAALNAMAEGKSLRQIFLGNGGTQNQGQESELVNSLQAEIQQLKEELYGFRDSISERETKQAQAQGEQAWKSWVEKQSASGVKVTDEVEQRMIPFIGAIRNAHQDWDADRILNEAYRHANIDSLEQGAVKKVLTSADDAKKGKVPKITPKAPAKSDKDMTYSEIMLNNS